MITEIYLIRHGESEANLSHRACGFTDSPLTDLGRLQAKITAEALADLEVDAIFSSDLSRAYETAIAHAELRGTSVIKSEALREIHLGEWEYMQVDDIVAKYGRESYHGGWRENFGTYIIPGSEGAVNCGKRIFGEIKRICDSADYRRIFIVSHGAAIRSFYSLVLGLAPEEMGKAIQYPSNASYSVVTYDGESFTAKEYSVDSHMEKIGITKVNW